MKYDIKVRDKEAKKYLTKMSPRLVTKVKQKALFRIGVEGAGQAGEKAPYRTGNLRRSLTWQTKTTWDESYSGFVGNVPRLVTPQKANLITIKDTVYIGSNLKYAKKMEYTHRTRKHFLKKVYDKLKQGGAIKIFNEELKREYRLS